MTANAANSAYSELYSAYAAGALDPAFALLVETQAALRGDVREALAISEVIAAAHFEAAEPTMLSDGALQQALASIDALTEAARPARAAEAASSALQELLALPEPLKEVALMAAGDQGWKFAGPGLRRLNLDVSDAAEVELFRIEPGAAVPRHTHESSELSLVVQGGFSDETGSFGPGDLSVKGPEDTHQPIADEDGVCIVLAVRDGGLRFKGVLGVIQRLLS